MNTPSISTLQADRKSFTSLEGLLVALTLVVLICWSAWDLGGAYPATKFGVAITMAILFFVVVVRRLLHGALLDSVDRLLLIVGLFWLIGLLQTFFIPGWLLEWLSPASFAAYTRWIPSSIASEASTYVSSVPSENWAPISIAPDLTRLAMVVPILFGAAYWLSSQVFSSNHLKIAFLFVISHVGGIFALLGILDAVYISSDEQTLSVDKLWITPQLSRDSFGPFVNNNNAGGFLSLCLGCAFGCLVWVRRRSAAAVEIPHSTFSRLSNHFFLVSTLLSIVLLIAGILASESRGAFLGVTVGLMCVYAVMKWSLRDAKTARFLSGGGTIASVLLLAYGLFSRVSDRVGTIWGDEAMSNPRLDHWRDSAQAAWEFLPFGAALGTYSYAHLPFQAYGGKSWFIHADGMPFEWLLEGGPWLLLLVGVFYLAITIRLSWISRGLSLQQKHRRGSSEAIFFTGVFVLPSLLVSQIFDYGILQPPVFITFALICGGIVATNRSQKFNEVRGLESTRSGYFVLVGKKVKYLTSALCLSMFGIGFLLSVIDLHIASTVDRYQAERIANLRLPIQDRESQHEAIANLESLAKFHPRSASVHILLAKLLMDEQSRVGAKYLRSLESVDNKALERAVAPRTVRNKLIEMGEGSTLRQLMLPGQDHAAWRLARSHAVLALACRPFDDSARAILLDLDMLDGRSDETSPILKSHIRKLRSQDERIQGFTSQWK